MSAVGKKKYLVQFDNGLEKECSSNRLSFERGKLLSAACVRNVKCVEDRKWQQHTVLVAPSVWFQKDAPSLTLVPSVLCCKEYWAHPKIPTLGFDLVWVQPRQEMAIKNG